jgi:beta-lactamase superfamily II metal-dependent hydrolase
VASSSEYSKPLSVTPLAFGVRANTETPEECYGKGENASSVGVIIKKGQKTAFLGADFTNDSNLEKIYADDIGDVDLLKIGHHGYYGSSSADFLKVLKPWRKIWTFLLR